MCFQSASPARGDRLAEVSRRARSIAAAVVDAGLSVCTSRDWPAACLASSDDPGAAIATFFRKIVGEAQTTLIVAEALASAGVDLAHSAADTKAAFNRVLERLLRRAQQAGAVRADIALGELVALIVGVSRAVHHLGHDPALQLLTTPGAAFGAQSALFAEPNER